MARGAIRRASLRDLGLLVRHRRGMWKEIAQFSKADLDVADRAYRRWAGTQMRSNRFTGFIVDVDGRPVASGCVWIMQVQPRPNWKGTEAAYLLSMFTEPAHRGRGHGARIVREAIRYAKGRGIHVMLLHASPFGEPMYQRLGFERTKEMRLFLDRGKGRPRTPYSRKTQRRAR